MRSTKMIDGVVWDGKDPKPSTPTVSRSRPEAGAPSHRMKEPPMVSAVFHTPLEAAAAAAEPRPATEATAA
jgi:hypothetical protein